ncbi:MAG: MotA/TolQ/ExbB proton channel family protein [Pseudomonadota bacterium]|nr:MotA/TolQ/ExbB proton channel family protein [Pseudomonadota bacterium]
MGAVIAFFQSGGVFMYPIVVVLALGIAIALERYWFLSLAQLRNRKAWSQVVPLLRGGKYQDAKRLVDESGASVSTVLRYGLAKLSAARRRDDLQMAMEEGLMEVIPRLEKRTHYLATLANIATLLGLLGTIMGLIQAFTAVATANPADKADMLSASISVAMNTTAFGLMVGIPLLLIHAVLQTKSTQLVDNMEMVLVKVVNLIGDQRQAAS